MPASFLSSSPWMHEPVVSPELKLWRGVLGLAYEDAELQLSLEDEDWMCIEQDRARRFLRADTPHDEEGLKLVCDYADVPFDRVVTWARQRYPRAA